MMDHQFEELQGEQGCTDETLLQLLLDYVNEHNLNESVGEYLEHRARVENNEV